MIYFCVAFNWEIMCMIIPRLSECSVMTQGSGLKYSTDRNNSSCKEELNVY